jgi:hypothetical protein
MSLIETIVRTDALSLPNILKRVGRQEGIDSAFKALASAGGRQPVSRAAGDVRKF